MMDAFGGFLIPPTAGVRPEMPGLLTGIVKENWEDKHPGMVKVEYTIGEEGKNVSGWVPVMSPYTGGGFGLYMLPEIGTEVILGFLMGDRSRPIVLGSLWNKMKQLPENTVDKENNIKLFKTRGGVAVQISEEKGKEKITIQTPGELIFTMDDEKQAVTCADKSAKNQILINAKDGKIEISADKKVVLKAGGQEVIAVDGSKAAIKDKTISLEAGQSLKVKGQSSKYEGASVEVKASGTMKLEASGIAQVKGSMLKLN